MVIYGSEGQSALKSDTLNTSSFHLSKLLNEGLVIIMHYFHSSVTISTPPHSRSDLWTV